MTISTPLIGSLHRSSSREDYLAAMSDHFLTVKVAAADGTACEMLQLQKSTTTGQLLELICDALKAPKKNIPLLSIRNAYTRDELDMQNNTVHELGINNMDKLFVYFKQPPKVSLGRNSMKPVSTKQTRKAASDARSKIAIQEKEHTKRMKEQSRNKSRQRKKKTKPAPSAPKSNKKLRIEGGGYELDSGNYIPPGTGTSGKRGTLGRRVPSGYEGIVTAFTGSVLKDEVSRVHSSNLGNSLIAAVDSGNFRIEIAKGGDDLEGGILLGKREDYKKDECKALGSVNTNSVNTKSDLGEGRNDAGGTTVLGTSEESGSKHALVWMKVSYSKMVEGRGTVEKSFQIIPLGVVLFSLKLEYEKRMDFFKREQAAQLNNRVDERRTPSHYERLTPSHIAEHSEQTFWSLVFHCTNGGRDKDKTVEDMLCQSLGDLDWSYLNLRRIQLQEDKECQKFHQQQGKSAQTLIKEEMSVQALVPATTEAATRKFKKSLLLAVAYLELAVEKCIDEDHGVRGRALKIIKFFGLNLIGDVDEEEEDDDEDEDEEDEGEGEGEGEDDDDDDDDDDEDEDEDIKMAHLSLVECRIMLNKCDKILTRNGLDGTFMDMLLMTTEGIRGTFSADISSTSTSSLYGAMRVGYALAESSFGPGAMVMLSLISSLLAWVMDLSHVEEGDNSALEYRKGVFSQYWLNAVEWIGLVQMMTRKHLSDDDTKADANETISDIQHAICHVQLIMNEMRKGETMALIHEGDNRVRGNESVDGDLCSLMLKGKSHERY